MPDIVSSQEPSKIRKHTLFSESIPLTHYQKINHWLPPRPTCLHGHSSLTVSKYFPLVADSCPVLFILRCRFVVFVLCLH